MLMMFSEEIEHIPLDKALALGSNDLLVMWNKEIAIGLKNIQNEKNEFFSIKTIMESEKEFACTNFEEKCEQFAKVMDTRLERFFVSKKTSYVFFDEEEQQVISKILKKNKLNCCVSIYIREEENETFKEVDFEEISSYEYLRDPLLKNVKQCLRKLNIKYVIPPDRYIELKEKRTIKNSQFKNNVARRTKAIEAKQMEQYFKKYNELVNIETNDEFKTFYRSLARAYHPDRNDGEDTLFKEMKADFDKIEETMWYKNLGKKQEKINENDSTAVDNTNVSEKTIFSKICKNKDGKMYKLFKAMTEKK